MDSVCRASVLPSLSTFNKPSAEKPAFVAPSSGPCPPSVGGALPSLQVHVVQIRGMTYDLHQSCTTPHLRSKSNQGQVTKTTAKNEVTFNRVWQGFCNELAVYAARHAGTSKDHGRTTTTTPAFD